MATEGRYDNATSAPAPAARGQMRIQRTMWFPRRADYTSETKPFFLRATGAGADVASSYLPSVATLDLLLVVGHCPRA